MNVRKMTATDVERVAAVHASVLPGSINGRLGPSHLAKLYARLVDGADFVGHVAEHRGGIVAFQISSTDWRAARHRLAQISISSKLRVATTCVLHPLDLIALLESVLLVPAVFARTGIRAEIITWAALPQNPIAAVGAHRCIMSSMSELVARGESMCLGQMQKPNDRAMAYYARLPHRIVASFPRSNVLVVDCVQAIARGS